MMIKDIAYERRRTRDLLLEYDISIMPPHPRAAGLNMIYPWENMPTSVLSHQLYMVAQQNGYNGSEQLFLDNFGNFVSDKTVLYAKFIDFPEIGETNKLYFDLDEKILYYWDGKYIPVNAMLIANTIIDGGEA